MTAKIIDGLKLASEIRSEVAQNVTRIKETHQITPGLAVVLVGDDPASKVYVQKKQEAATESGMLAKDVRLPVDTSISHVISKVEELNADPDFHGVLVQMPLPNHLDVDSVINELDPKKDVDGLHPENVGLLLSGKHRFIPATPAGIQQMLLRNGHDPEGKHVVICGRSMIVGKPVSSLMMQKLAGANATVTVCHTSTRNLSEITSQADILIAAMGHPRAITADMVKDGAVVIDVGTNRIPASNRKRGWRLVGDVDFEGVVEKAAAISPVPGGVGPMTIAMLLKNTLTAAKMSRVN